MSGEMSASERREYRALLREQERLLAEREQLRSEFDALAADIDELSRPPREMAELCEEAAAADPEERAQNLSEAAGYWAMDGELDRAKRAHLAAIADGGPVPGDARVWYAVFQLEHGDEQAGTALLETVFAEGTDDYVFYETAAETFEAMEQPQQALRWFEAGLSRLRVLGEDTDERFGEHRLALGRRRIRQSLGLPKDVDDQWAEQERRDELEADLRSEEPHPVAFATFYLPESEFAHAVRRWPELREQYGNHDEHRAQVERNLRSIEPGRSPRVAAATVAGLVEYADAEGLDPARSQTRAAYAAELSRIGADISWPPGRNDPCWCGSFRKYKKCCGRPG